MISSTTPSTSMSRRERRVLKWYAISFGLLLLILGLTLIAQFGIESIFPPGAADIRIAVQAPLTGTYAGMGQEIRNGVQLAVEDFAGALTAKGYNVSLVVYDDQGQVDTAAWNAARLGRDSAVLGVVGHLNASQIIPAASQYIKFDLPYIVPASSNAALSDSKLHARRFIGRDDVQGVAGAQFIRQLRLQRVALLEGTNTYDQLIAKSFQTAAQNQGLNLVSSTTLSPEKSVADIAAEVAKATPSVIYYSGQYGDLEGMISALKGLTITVPIVGPDSLNTPVLADIISNTQATVYYSALALPIGQYPDQYPSAGDFVKRYQDRFSSVPGLYVAESYDAARLLLAAIDRAATNADGKRPTRLDVAKALSQVSIETLSGRSARLSSSGELVESPYYIMRATATTPDLWGTNPVSTTLVIRTP